MTYEEYFQHLQELHKLPSDESTEQEIDEEIALISQLPCTGGGAPEPLFGGQREGVHVLLDVRALDSGEKFPGHPCPHCTWLAFYKWAKSNAKRDRTPPAPTFEQEVNTLAKSIAEASANSSFREWLAVNNGVCPNCGMDFKQMGADHPLHQHFVGNCKDWAANPPALPES